LKNPRFWFFAKKFIIKELSIIPVISDTLKISGFHGRIDGSPSSSLPFFIFLRTTVNMSKPVLSTVSQSVSKWVHTSIDNLWASVCLSF
jgi:hypothetical protein